MANVTFPRDTTNDIDNTKVAKPEYLYAYKDPNAGTPLYGWTQGNVDLYTRSATPVVGMPLYDSTGVATGDTIYQVNQDGTWDLPPVTLTINPIPSDAIVTFNTAGTVSGNSIIVPYNTTVSYSVSHSSLETQNKSITVKSDITETVTLSYASGTVLFESSNAGTHSVTPLVPTDVNIICVGGGGGGCAGYVTNGSGYQNATAAGGGGSGGYSNQNVTIPAEQINIIVGKGGTGASGGYNRDGGNWSATAGGSSSVSNLVSAAGGTGASVGTSYSSVTKNVSASVGNGSSGSGTTSNGNNGSRDSDSNMYTVETGSYGAGGVSVYNNYGKGGNAQATVKTVDVLTLFGDNGGSGYIKITVI
ncbi:MAG: hypothetical protein IJ880_13790 [Bacilli bacterium]|nr:hypothetical protein [Bacilli bacterium]